MAILLFMSLFLVPIAETQMYNDALVFRDVIELNEVLRHTADYVTLDTPLRLMFATESIITCRIDWRLMEGKVDFGEKSFLFYQINGFVVSNANS